MSRNKLSLLVPVVTRRAGTGFGVWRVRLDSHAEAELARATDGVKRMINLIKVGDNR